MLCAHRSLLFLFFRLSLLVVDLTSSAASRVPSSFCRLKNVAADFRFALTAVVGGRKMKGVRIRKRRSICDVSKLFTFFWSFLLSVSKNYTVCRQIWGFSRPPSHVYLWTSYLDVHKERKWGLARWASQKMTGGGKASTTLLLPPPHLSTQGVFERRVGYQCPMDTKYDASPLRKCEVTRT